MASYLDWKVGDKVVFVHEGTVTVIRRGWRKYLPAKLLTHNLVAGEVYTVSGITTQFDHLSQTDVVSVYLRGFAFREAKNVPFPAIWFRKVQTRKTDISCFEAILRGARVPEVA